MAILTRGTTYGASETITNTKLHTLVDSGTCTSIVNADVAANAAIAYSKLNLTGNITDADISSSAAISGSKLNLASPGNIGSTTPGTAAFSTLKVGTTNQGDVLYDNGTSLVRLPPGTSGQFLKTQGTSANPTWDNAIGSILDYSTSTSSSTAKLPASLKIAYGSQSISASSSATITNLPFTSTGSFQVFINQGTNSTANENLVATIVSASSITIFNKWPSGTLTINWFCIGT